jgi:hypothetical protein
MIEHEGPPLPIPPPAIWGIWYEGGHGDPPGWSDLCLSEAEARRRLEAGILPEHRHHYRVALAGVTPARLAAAKAERDKLIEASLAPHFCNGYFYPRLGEHELPYTRDRDAAIAAVRKAAGLGGHADAQD